MTGSYELVIYTIYTVVNTNRTTCLECSASNDLAFTSHHFINSSLSTMSTRHQL